MQKPLNQWTKGQINKALDKVDKAQSALCDRLIEIGRGAEPCSQICKKSDPLSLQWKALVDQRYALRHEIERRYGPGAPSRLP